MSGTRSAGSGGQTSFHEVRVREGDAAQERFDVRAPVDRTREIEWIAEVVARARPSVRQHARPHGGEIRQLLRGVHWVAVGRVGAQAEGEADSGVVRTQLLDHCPEGELADEERVVHYEGDEFGPGDELEDVGSKVPLPPERHARVFDAQPCVEAFLVGGRGRVKNSDLHPLGILAAEEERREGCVQLQRAVLAEDDRGQRFGFGRACRQVGLHGTTLSLVPVSYRPCPTPIALPPSEP